MPYNEILAKHRDAFDALEEHDRTGQMPRLTRKVRINITIDAHLLQRFRETLGRRGAKLSTTIEALLRERIGEN